MNTHTGEQQHNKSVLHAKVILEKSCRLLAINDYVCAVLEAKRRAQENLKYKRERN